MAEQFKLAKVKYNKDSYILIEGAASCGRFFIIQEGNVRIARDIDKIMGANNSGIGRGELFGVVAAMTGLSNVETVIALSEVTLLGIDRKQYGDLIRTNGPVAMKIIQQFSQRLRMMDETLSRQKEGASSAHDPSFLYEMAETYLALNRLDYAFYAYQQFVKHNPESEQVNGIRDKLMQLSLKVKITTPEFPADAKRRTYPKDCMIFAEGEPGNELYIVENGTVKITKLINGREVVLALLKKGDIFGEMALLEDKPRTANVETNEECTLFAVNRSNFSEIIKEQPELVSRLTSLFAERIWLSSKQLANTLIIDPLGRLYDALLIQLEKNRVPISADHAYSCSFGYKELAGMASLSAEESNEAYKKFLLRNRITEINDKIVITDTSEVLRQSEYYRKMEARQQTAQKKHEKP
jgi:CRP-like cAMP-binding protein